MKVLQLGGYGAEQQFFALSQVQDDHSAKKIKFF
jgi:hypothetical protein